MLTAEAAQATRSLARCRSQQSGRGVGEIDGVADGEGSAGAVLVGEGSTLGINVGVGLNSVFSNGVEKPPSNSEGAEVNSYGREMVGPAVRGGAAVGVPEQAAKSGRKITSRNLYSFISYLELKFM